MNRSIILYFLLIVSTCTFSQNAHVFEKDGQYGLKNAKNKTVVKASFDNIKPFRDKLFLIEKNNKTGVISEVGEIIFSPMYDDIKNFGDNYFAIKNDNGWGIVSPSMETVLPFEYSSIERLSDYLFVVNKGLKKGVINTSGKMLVQPYYNEITSLSALLYMLKDENSVSIIDNLGKPVISGNYNSFEKLPLPNLYKVSVGDKVGFVNLAGKVIVEPIFDYIDYSNPDFIILRKGEKLGFLINEKYIPPVYDKIMYTQSELGLMVVKEGNLCGVITASGNVVPPVYENISRFSPNGYAFVEKKGKLMYLDASGKERSLQEVSGNVKF